MRFGAYIYVDGYDLDDVAESIKKRLAEVAGLFPKLRVIDDRFERTPDLHSEDLPVWNLGLNFDLDVPSASFVRPVLERVRALSRESGRVFAVGYYDRASRVDEDIGFVEADSDLDDIARILELLSGNGEPSAGPNERERGHAS
jgi:hypothetical protein